MLSFLEVLVLSYITKVQHDTLAIIEKDLIPLYSDANVLLLYMA